MEKGEEERGNLAGVQHIILVLSGKGGVGKSTISTELALAFKHAGKKVGILDVDLCGPSIPRMLSVQDRDVHQSLIKQFIADVTWGELDFLIVDTPPGTSDEHISTVESLRPFKPLGAVLVTTPQAVAVGDVRRADILQENRPAHPWDCGEHERLRLSPLLAPECTNLFSKGGGEELAKHAGVPFLGCVPLDPQLTQSLEEGRDFLQEFPKSLAFLALTDIAQRLLAEASTCSS
ncbi:hypothetical protein E2320_012081 [Naja naja]|nr:hypothetical protein E2320_012081 [Naja naja]